ncbi:MAG: recombinase family protein [Gemmataceae bacterium]|nr:recombinase family protein [Gemmataceae bacterium]
MTRDKDRKSPPAPTSIRCAIYTRKSTEEGLEQEFNSLDAQREAAEAFIKSQAHEGWTLLPAHYDDCFQTCRAGDVSPRFLTTAFRHAEPGT